MSLPLKIAIRYLFSKKSHSAINIISMVSICGVAVTTMALICTLSVYNGFQDLIASLYSSLDPQIKVIPATGKTLSLQDPSIKSLAEWQEIDAIAPVIEENALLTYRNRQMPVLLKGVPDNYSQVSNIDSILLDGNFFLKDSVANYATIGVGVANRLEVGAHYVYPLSVYTPKRKAKVNLANPSNAFNEDRMFATAVFSVNQPEYDDQMVIVPLDMAAKLFDYPQQARYCFIIGTSGKRLSCQRPHDAARDLFQNDANRKMDDISDTGFYSYDRHIQRYRVSFDADHRQAKRY